MRLPVRTLLAVAALLAPLPARPAGAPRVAPDAAATAGPDRAADGAGAGAAKEASWIDPAALRLERVLPPPPAPGSPAEAADLAAVRAAIESRTAADEARIAADVPRTYDRFAEALGPAYAPARVPKLVRLMQRVFADGEIAVRASKAAIARTRRPYVLDPGLRTLGHRSTHPAYPSGHTVFAYLGATVLGVAAPGRRDALFARAAQLADNRLQAGVHFPTDLDGGRIAAAVVAEALLRDPGFRRDLAEAAAEARAAAGEGR